MTASRPNPKSGNVRCCAAIGGETDIAQAPLSIAASKAGQMAASDYAPIFFKNRLHLVGRSQLRTRPSIMRALNRREPLPVQDYDARKSQGL